VTHPDDETARDLLPALLRRLRADDVGLVTDVLAGSKEPQAARAQDADADSAWCDSCMCVARLPEAHAPPELARPLRHRRLDLKIYPMELLPFALLYFTGNDHFNRSMRFWAKQARPRGALLRWLLHHNADVRQCGAQRFMCSLSDKGLVKSVSHKSGAAKAAVRARASPAKPAPVASSLTASSCSTPPRCAPRASATSSRRWSWSTWNRSIAACETQHHVFAIMHATNSTKATTCPSPPLMPLNARYVLAHNTTTTQWCLFLFCVLSCCPGA
jgi:hypothetical protein